LIRYNPRVLEVIDVDAGFLLAAEGSFQPFVGLADPLPDRDGALRFAVLDTASQTYPQENVESGPGVLARLKFRVKAEGASRLRIGFNRAPYLEYPMVLDTQNEVIEVGSLGSITVAAGRSCHERWETPRIRPLPPISQLEQ
jgi:hypothetical protein